MLFIAPCLTPPPTHTHSPAHPPARPPAPLAAPRPQLEIAAESAHPDFRCFFSAEPINGAPQAKIIPESILQTCIKVSNEPPSDMKSNMRRAFAAFTPEQCDRPSTPAKRVAFRSILFGLCFYHSLLLGRKKFGVGIGTGSGSGLGFCRGYSFNIGDLTTCGDVLYNYLEAYESIPWKDLQYMFGEVFYGGHITDAMDRRCCTTYLEVLIRQEILPVVSAGRGGAGYLVTHMTYAGGFAAAALMAHLPPLRRAACPVPLLATKGAFARPSPLQPFAARRRSHPPVRPGSLPPPPPTHRAPWRTPPPGSLPPWSSPPAPASRPRCPPTTPSSRSTSRPACRQRAPSCTACTPPRSCRC